MPVVVLLMATLYACMLSFRVSGRAVVVVGYLVCCALMPVLSVSLILMSMVVLSVFVVLLCTFVAFAVLLLLGLLLLSMLPARVVALTVMMVLVYGVTCCMIVVDRVIVGEDVISTVYDGCGCVYCRYYRY